MYSVGNVCKGNLRYLSVVAVGIDVKKLLSVLGFACTPHSLEHCFTAKQRCVSLAVTLTLLDSLELKHRYSALMFASRLMQCYHLLHAIYCS